jgi:hypothetical protein
VRSRNVLILIILALGLMSEALVGKKEIAAQLSVRQEFESEIHNLKKNIAISRKKTGDQRWQALEKAENEVEKLRSENPRQFEPDELYMDLVMASLEEIPRGSEFKRDNCLDYKASILAHFDPQNEDKLALPVSQSLSVLEALCK